MDEVINHRDNHFHCQNPKCHVELCYRCALVKYIDGEVFCEDCFIAIMGDEISLTGEKLRGQDGPNSIT